MKYSHRLSDAVHILVYIGICKEGDLSSVTIAKSVDSNPSLVRRLMSMLVKADILSSQPGVSAPQLAKSPQKISLLDVYHAVEEEGHLLHVDKETNPNCLIGSTIQETLNDAYQKVQLAAEDKMQSISLQSLMDDLMNRQQKNHSIESAAERDYFS